MRGLLKRVIQVAAVAVLMAACEKQPDVLPEAVLAAYQSAVNDGDGAKIASFFTDDAAVLPPNAPAVIGRPALDAYYKATASGGYLVQTTAGGTIAADGYVVLRTAYNVFGKSHDIVETGKGIELWKKTAGTWKLYWVMWSEDKPPPAPAVTPVDAAPASAD